MERLREIGCDIYYTMYGGQITLEMGEENEADEENREELRAKYPLITYK